MGDGPSFETERWRDGQPARDDLIDPEAIDPDDAVSAEGGRADDERADDAASRADGGAMPDPEDLPESQGDDVVEAERRTEDAAARPRLSDEDR